MAQYYTVLTEAGEIAIANATISQTKVNITTLAVGDGNGSEYSPTGSETALKREVWRGPTTQVSLDPDNLNHIVVNSAVPSEVGGFVIREFGLFDVDGVLIAIANYPETYKPVIGDGTVFDLSLDTVIEVNNVDAVEVIVDPNVITASKKYVDEIADTVRIVPDKSLKVAMHFNSTAESEVRERAEIFRKLGYNTILMSRNNAALTDITGTNAKKLFKLLSEYGIGVIVQVDYDTLKSSNFTPVSDFISAIDTVHSVVGYWFTDEPFDRELPSSDTQLAYTRLKTLTQKPIFVTDPCRKLSTYNKCFDVLFLNIYNNAPMYSGFTRDQTKLAMMNIYVNIFKSGRVPPNKVIPMYPTYAQFNPSTSAYLDTLPTVEQIDTLLEFYRHSGISGQNVSAFMFHFFNSSPFDDLYNNEYLKFISNYIMQNYTDSQPQDIVSINRTNLKSSKSFVSTNTVPSTTFDSLVMSNVSNAEIVLKVTKQGRYNANKLFFYATVHNNGDNVPKTLDISISYDGTTFTNKKLYPFAATSGTSFPLTSDGTPAIEVDNTADSVFIKFKIRNTDDSDVSSGAMSSIGFKNIRLGFL